MKLTQSTHQIYWLNLAGICAVALYCLFQNLSIFSFDIDELIITENINRSLADYLQTNSAYFYWLKLSLWGSEHLLWGGPSAWRTPSILGLLSINLICFRLLKNIGASVIWVPLTAFVCVGNAFQYYGRWGMTGYMLSSAALCIAFYMLWCWQASSFPRPPFLGLWAFLAGLITTFFYLGESVSFFALILSACAWDFLARRRQALSYWLRALSLIGLAVFASCYLILWANGGLNSPRTSIQPLYFPTAGVSLWQFTLGGLTTILKQAVAPASYISNWSLLGLGLLVVWSVAVIPVSVKVGLARICGFLSIWIFAMLAGVWLLSLFGLAPFGNLRYLKALIWVGPLWLLSVITLLALQIKLQLPKNWLAKLENNSLLANLIGAAIVIFFGVCTLKSVWGFGSYQSENYAKTQAAYHWKADLVLVDELHKFGYEYLTHNNGYTLMSRTYPCQDGRFWNAYGWNDCDVMKTKPESSYLGRLNSSDSLLIISRGPFDVKGYENWFNLVSNSGFKLVKLQNFGGPYVSLWEKSRLERKIF